MTNSHHPNRRQLPTLLSGVSRSSFVSMRFDSCHSINEQFCRSVINKFGRQQ